MWNLGKKPKKVNNSSKKRIHRYREKIPLFVRGCTLVPLLGDEGDNRGAPVGDANYRMWNRLQGCITQYEEYSQYFCNNCEWSSTFKNRLKKLSEQREIALHTPPDNKYGYVIGSLFEATGRIWMRNVPPLADSGVSGTGSVVSGPGHALLPYRCKPGRDN